MLKRRSIRASARGASAMGGATGDLQLDLAIEQHKQLEETADAVDSALAGYLNKVREVSQASAKVTRSFETFFDRSPLEQRARAFAEAHNHVDTKIPDKLLEVADQHIVTKLAEFKKQLADVRVEIKAFQEEQSKFQHYSDKVKKLNEEKIKREKDNKVEKTKHIERLTRNAMKLDDATKARDLSATALLSRLRHIHNQRNVIMAPVFRNLFLFQQELHKQSWNALNVELPEASPEELSGPTTTAPLTPVQTPQSAVFDAQGNRVADTPSPYSGTTQSAASPTSNGEPVAYGAYSAAPEPPVTTSRPAAARPPPPPPPSAAPGPFGSSPVNYPGPGAAGGAGPKTETAHQPHDSLVNKWFST